MVDPTIQQDGKKMLDPTLNVRLFNLCNRNGRGNTDNGGVTLEKKCMESRREDQLHTPVNEQESKFVLRQPGLP